MADDLDRFVLSYTVDLKDSVYRLEKLHEKMDGVKSKSSKAAAGFKEFATGAASELNKLAPGIDAVSKAVSGLGAEFAAAGAAVGLLAIGVKSVMDLRSQFNAQRAQGIEMGMSPVRLEDMQRKLVRTGGGYVTRDSAAKGMEQMTEMARAAYTDPSGLGESARKMRMLGLDPRRNYTGKELATALGGTLSGMSDVNVQGDALALGIDPNWMMSVKRQGAQGMGNITDMTSGDIAKRDQAQDSLDKFNSELERFKSNINQLEIALGENLLPAADKFLEWVTKLVGVFNHAVSTSTSAANDSSKKYIVGPGHTLTPNPNYVGPDAPSRSGHFGPGHTWIEDPTPPADPHKVADDAAKKAAAASAEQQKRNALALADDQTNGEKLQADNAFLLGINLFSQAVGQFSDSIDMHQALAAWAGEAGKNSAIPGSSTWARTSGGQSALGGSMTGGGSGAWGKSPYSAQIAAAAKATGLDPQLIYSVMQTESHGVNGQYSSTGAGGLMQIIKSNWKKMGGRKDIMNPKANIMVGAQILKEQIGLHKGDVAAGLVGYNGNSDPNYVSKVAQNYGGSALLSAGAGQSRASLQLQSVQQMVASALGVPLAQVQQGGVRAADAAWVLSGMYISGMRSLNSEQMQLAALKPGMPLYAQNYGKLQMELRDQTRGLALMKQYGAGVVGQQQAGGQERTQGAYNPTINIDISGVTDPHAVAAEVQKQLDMGMSQVLNHYTDGVKG